MPRGRPKKYNSAEAMQKKINQYFAECEEKGNPMTMAGLAYALDMDRKSPLNYSGEEEFFPAIKKARQKVEAYAEAKLFTGNATGVIFNLVNNFGWHNTSEVKQEVKVSKLEDII